MPDLFGFEIPNPFSVASNIYAQVKTDERQADAQEFNASQAEIQRDYQTKMANSAWQRGMTDMKAAGLNPILAYQKGPASSPTGAAASTSYSPATDVLTPAVSSAQHGQRLNFEVQKMQEEVKNLRETNRNIAADTELKGMQTVQSGAQVSQIGAQTRIAHEMLSEAQRKAGIAQTDKGFYDSTWGKVMRVIGNTGGELTRWSPFTGSAPAINNSFKERWP